MTSAMSALRRIAMKPAVYSHQNRYLSTLMLRRWNVLNGYHRFAVRRGIETKIGASMLGMAVSFGCYQCLSWNNINAATMAKAGDSKFSDEEWTEIAAEINGMGHSLKKSVQIHWYEYLAVIGSICCFGVGVILWPVWKWYFYKKTIRNLRIGRLRCRLTGSFRSYLFEVVSYYMVFTVITMGMYPVFGFGFVHESHWFDSHTVWYVPQSQADAQ